MKYIKATIFGVFKTDNITVEDLGRAKRDNDYIIINRIEETYFDAEKNEWLDIKNIDVEDKDK